MEDLSTLLGGLGLGSVAVAIVTAVAAHVLDIRATNIRRDAEIKSVASALGGEIEALLRLGRDRYRPSVQVAIEHLKEGGEYPLGPAYSGAEMFGVYRAHLPRLGDLPHELTHGVAELYTRMLMIQEALRSVIMAEWDTRPIEHRLEYLRRLDGRMGDLDTYAVEVQRSLKSFVSSGQRRVIPSLQELLDPSSTSGGRTTR